MWILQIRSDNLPQWLPIVIDCGLGGSVGFQNIPASARSQVGEAISRVIGNLFGIRTEEQQLLQPDEAYSSRRRGPDIEAGSMA